MGPKSRDHPNGNAAREKKGRPVEHTSPLWSSVWWKRRKDRPDLTAQKLGKNNESKYSNKPIRSSAIRDINGKLCRVDLHSGFDIPPLEEKTQNAISANEPPNWLEQEIRPLSIKRVSTPKDPETPKSPSNIDPFYIREKGAKDENAVPSARSYSPSRYFGSKYSLVSQEAVGEPPDTYERPLIRVGITLDTNVKGLESDFTKLVYKSLPSTPDEIRGFGWSKDSVDSRRGIIVDIDRFGNSIYETPQNRVGNRNPGYIHENSAGSLNSTAAEELAAAKLSASEVYGIEEVDVESIDPQVPDSMLAIRRQLIKNMPHDDELSELSSILGAGNGSGSFYSQDSNASDSAFPANRLELSDISIIQNSTCEDNVQSVGILLPEIRVDGVDDRPTESGLINKVKSTEDRQPSMIDNWQSDISHTTDTTVGLKPRRISENRYETETEGGKRLLACLIGGLEPINAASLKRLPDISRRRIEQDSSSRCETENDHASIGLGSARDFKANDEMTNLRQQANSALPQVTQFQAIINRTSQRYINAQYQNLELQRENTELNRQISDLRDHQRVIHEALDNTATKSVTDDIKIRRLARVDEDNFHLLEENHRLRDQVKTLTQELAISEEEKRILGEELQRQTTSKENER
ncbi:hypothetical protein TWF694_006298 [Orbilia ellipsospora]|uniref:Uncharacterized protein n=1 Tax=Orbilia ellipsospora TaxID=2528407 RepID=A0AAV9XMA3_9PEZI